MTKKKKKQYGLKDDGMTSEERQNSYRIDALKWGIKGCDDVLKDIRNRIKQKESKNEDTSGLLNHLKTFIKRKISYENEMETLTDDKS